MISIFFLSFIQGIAEFLPISSSYHLIIFRDVFLVGKDIITDDISLTFDVALHFGTFLAIIIYFYKDFIIIIKNGISNGFKDEKGKLMWYIVIATIPAAIIGFLFDDFLENIIRTKILLITISFIIMGIVIYVADIKNSQNKSIENLKIKDALFLGIFQMFALIPGFSRSGTTIVGARLLKMNREDATRISFYLSFPILFGAFLFQLFKVDFSIICNHLLIFITGITTSFVVGLMSIKLLLGYVKNNNYMIFMLYRILFGLIIIAYLLINHI